MSSLCQNPDFYTCITLGNSASYTFEICMLCRQVCTMIQTKMDAGWVTFPSGVNMSFVKIQNVLYIFFFQLLFWVLLFEPNGNGY